MLIDFGLAYTCTLAEDKAVDLYVLERALASTHPHSAECVFAGILAAYAEAAGPRVAPGLLARFTRVRRRGRKRAAEA